MHHFPSTLLRGGLAAAAALLLFTGPAPAEETALPPGAEGAAAALEKSPRHGEWINVTSPTSGAPIRTWIVYPETSGKAPVVVVIHEIFGLTDWVRAVADRLAADGFIALAPDLLSGKGPGGGGTESATSRDEVVGMIRDLDPGEVAARLDAVRDHGLALPAASGKSASIGFCWGGRTSFAYAAAQPGLDAAIVYYGTPPDDLSKVEAPVLGLYGGDDARVTSTVEPTEETMKRHGKKYRTHVYEGAGHGFLRQQDGREGANMKASEQAWHATLEFLRKHTR